MSVKRPFIVVHDPARPRWESERGLLDDWRSKSRSSEKGSDGRESYYFKGSASGKLEYREIWAHDPADVESRYPRLKLVVNEPILGEVMRFIGTSDVVEPDEFLSRRADQ